MILEVLEITIEGISISRKPRLRLSSMENAEQRRLTARWRLKIKRGAANLIAAD